MAGSSRNEVPWREDLVEWIRFRLIDSMKLTLAEIAIVTFLVAVGLLGVDDVLAHQREDALRAEKPCRLVYVQTTNQLVCEADRSK